MTCQVEDDLIAHYCRQLSKAGVMDCNHADIWNGYRRSAFARFMMGVTTSMVVEQTERGDAVIIAMCERSAAMGAGLLRIGFPRLGFNSKVE